MPERVRDRHGFVWVRNENVGDWWDPEGEFCSRARAEIDEDFGPLVYIDADGEPLNPQPPADDARALLAAAFEYHSSTAMRLCSEVGINPFDAGRLTAQALRSGEITA